VRVESDHSGVLSREVGADIYQLIKFKRSNQNTCINQKPLVRVGDRVRQGQVSPTVLAPSAVNSRSDATSWSRSFPGAAITSKTPSWSAKAGQGRLLTSIHIEEYEIEARDTKLGPEEITRDIPNISEMFLRNSMKAA